MIQVIETQSPYPVHVQIDFLNKAIEKIMKSPEIAKNGFCEVLVNLIKKFDDKWYERYPRNEFTPNYPEAHFFIPCINYQNAVISNTGAIVLDKEELKKKPSTFFSSDYYWWPIEEYWNRLAFLRWCVCELQEINTEVYGRF